MNTIRRVLVTVASSVALVLSGYGGQVGAVDLVAQSPTSAEAVTAITQTSQSGHKVKVLAARSGAHKVVKVNNDSQYSGNRSYKDRYENMLLPPGARPANEAARIGPWRSEPYELLYVGSRNTSIPFANEIHNTWLAIANPNTVNGTVVFDAWSPTTQKVYKVTCNEGPKYVTCTGGYNAVVYII